MTEQTTSVPIEVAVISDRGLSEKRPLNEDSYLSDPERRIFAVADGVGGAQAGGRLDERKAAQRRRRRDDLGDEPRKALDP